jgi:hypothetical protein
MGRPKGSKNKPKETKGTKKVGRTPKIKEAKNELELEEDRVKLQHTMDRVPMLSDDGYRLKETVSLLKIFGFSTKEIRNFLVDGTIPLK